MTLKEAKTTTHIPEFGEHICFYSKSTSFSAKGLLLSVHMVIPLTNLFVLWGFLRLLFFFLEFVYQNARPGGLQWIFLVGGAHILLCSQCSRVMMPNITCDYGSLDCCLQETTVLFLFLS